MNRLNKVSIAFISASWLAVLFVGLVSKTPMIGDEVTHYYMLVTQADRLPEPCFEAHIPLGVEGAGKEVRFYPHVVVWHYIGAILFRLTGLAAAIQIYHSLFLLQLLLVIYAMVGKMRGGGDVSRLLAIATVASLPATLIFAVAFYQDVPAVAQVMTAFYFLLTGKRLLASMFLAVSLGFKENMILFVPAYTVALCCSVWRLPVWRRYVAVSVTIIVLLSSCWFSSYAIMKYANGDYYPFQVLKVTVNKLLQKIGSVSADQGKEPEGSRQQHIQVLPTTLFGPHVIANHPGDLRIAKNWLVYGGGMLWLLLSMGLISVLKKQQEEGANKQDLMWGELMLFAGASYILLVWMFLEAPEARFFMPGALFIIIPASVYAARFPCFKTWIWIVVALSVMQSGLVLHKTFRLRSVSPGIGEAVQYLKREPPNPDKIFMYPEGNYRLFPCNHDWYLDYELRAFWRADNDQRLNILRNRGIGAIVVKKHLIAAIDQEMNNLGVYPDYFVHEIDRDARFRKVLENKDIIIYRLPAADTSPIVAPP